MDEDLEQLTRNELVAKVKKLRAGIRKHRDSTGMSCVGTIPNYGNSSRKRSIRI